MPAVEVLQLQSPTSLRLPAIEALLTRAFASSSLVPDWDDEVRQSLEHCMSIDFMYIWIALADGEPRGVLVLALPEGKLYWRPQVYLVYNAGPKAVVKALAAAGMDFLRQKGYNSYWGLNGLTDNDAAYARMFSCGGVAKRVGSVMEFTFDG